MGKYSMNEAEMRKALALLEHVEGEIREACNFINSAYRKISSQSGFGIREARRLMVNNGSVIDRQVENILAMKEYIQLVLERTIAASEGAKAEITSDELDKKLEDPEVIGSKPQGSQGTPSTGGGIPVSGASGTNLASAVGTTIANMQGEYYFSNKNKSYPSYVGQCTWYCYGRFYETTGINLNSSNSAKRWLSDNVGDNRVEITYGIENIRYPAVAVETSNPYGPYGHVLFVEGVERDTNGTITNVYVTECNSAYVGGWANVNGQYDAGADCVLQKISYAEYASRYNVTGYISAK